MKNSTYVGCAILVLLFVVSAIKTNAQADTNFFQSRNNFYQGAYGITDTNEAGIINQFKKYEYFQGPKFSPSGNFKEAFTQYKNWISDYTLNGETTSTLISDWESIGPHNTPAEGNSSIDFTRGVGRLICISLHPDNYEDTIYIGSPFGGAWKTYDAGQNWTNLNTDFLPVTKCSEIAINPYNTNIIFMATGDRDDYHNASISAGVYRSTDAGTTWAAVNTGLNFEGFYQISKILINPSNPDIAFLATSRGIYKTTNATTGCQWVQITDPLVYQKYFRNIIFKPDGLFSTIYASGKDIITSSNGGASWASMTGTGTGLDFPTFTEYPNPIRINITVSEDAPSKIFAYVSLSDETGQISFDSKVKVIVGIFDGSLWSIKDFLPHNKSSTFSYTSHGAGPAWMPIAVSPVNADHIYIGNVISWRTFDGGENWEPTFSYSGELIHPDCHDLKYSPDGQKLYLATDGGFYKITNPASTSSPSVVELNNGLTIGTITKIALTNQDEKFTLMGEIDCGSNKYDPSNLSPNPWKIIRGGDGTEQEINLNHMDTIYASTPKNNITFHDDRGESGYGSSLGSPANENSIFIPDYTLSPVNQNVIYANFTDLYKKQHPGSWERLSDFENDFGLYSGDPLTALDIAPNKPEHIYIAVEAYQVDAPSEYLLFKTTTGGYDNGCSSGCWSQMFPPTPNYITSIAVSPYNENEIWISYSGYTQNNKVKYFDGNTWHDFSSGLPNLPVNDIIFNYGSDNGIFAAMDNGVYYRDATMNQWESFKENLPNVTVSELEINYGFNKITAGTLGRGLWASSLSCARSDSVFSLSSNQYWNVPMRFDRNVIVRAGCVLTIGNNATLFFVPEAKIIVEPGGKLVINGGLLTSTCGDLWQGIEVWGNPQLSQIPANQGWLSISNGGTIQNAVVAVRMGISGQAIPDGGGLPPIDYKGGGILSSSEAVFRNNRSGVIFHEYYRSNVSNLSLSTFETTAELDDGSMPINHIRLLSVEGIRISGCTLRNTRDASVPYSQRGIGIQSYDASYYVDHICISQSMPCTEYKKTMFDRLNYGVKAFAISTALAPTIKNTEFTENYRAAYLSGITNPRITSNDFYLNSPAASESYGLYLDGCTGYWVEDNTFAGSGLSTEKGIGIVVNESGSAPNLIYLNAFNYVEYAINVQGHNRNGKLPAEGLEIRCNHYDNTLFDETIIYEGANDPPPSTDGIAAHQGRNTLNAEDMAGNLFYYNTDVAGDFDDINNQSNHFYYYYPSYVGIYDVEPLDYTANTVRKIEKPFSIWTYEDGCPSGLSSGGGAVIDEAYTAMAEAQADIDSTETVLLALVDGGDTETLNAEVENSTPPEAAEVYNELMAESPNLSETVVESSIEKEEVLPNTMIRDVMVANPHTSVSLQLLAKLDERSIPMPEFMKAQILAGRSIQSLKSELESRIAGYKLSKARAISRIAHYYGEVPNLPARTDSLLALYQADNSISSRYMQAWLYMQNGQYLQGQNVMTAIPADFTLHGDELTEHQNMQSFYTMLSQLHEAGKQFNELSVAQSAQLAAMAEAETGLASVFARNILVASEAIQYNEPVNLPNYTKSESAEEAFDELTSSPMPKMLEVYPNPSKEFVVLGYQFDTDTRGVIEIRNVAGRLIQSIPFDGMQDQLTVITRSWSPGMYIVSLVVNEKVIETTKFTLIN